MTLEEFKLKHKYLTAYAKYCSSRTCDDTCPVLQQHKQNKKGCYTNFCQMMAAGKLK